MLPEEPWKLMPLPPLPEMTLPTTPVASVGFSPMLLLDYVEAMNRPSPEFGAAAPARFRPM
jgi:hypothetical protein